MSNEHEIPEPVFPSSGSDSPITRRYGAYLPHWAREDGVYFVTFRLFDSLPQSVLARWTVDHERWVRIVRAKGTIVTRKEQHELQIRHKERIERYLDAGHGECVLSKDPVARVVANALAYFHDERYVLHTWCVMPNHVHVLVQPLRDWKLESILQSWKSYTAHAANRILGRRGTFWQQESFDHLIRSPREFGEKAEYIINNPHVAGLANWKWVGTRPYCGSDSP
jgi:REP element-mobilizing transposase RayT